MRNNSGSVLSQYAIVIALIGAVLIVAFLTIGGTITTQFTNFYNLLKSDSAQISQVVGSKEIAVPVEAKIVQKTNEGSGSRVVNKSYSSGQSSIADIGTVPNKPVELSEDPEISCNGSYCTIDYGEFVLTGIPSNFKDYIEIQGTSGGEEKIAAIMMELYEQLDETTEKPVKDALETLIGLIGSDLYTNVGGDGPCDQLSALTETYECMAGGSCDHMAESTFVPGQFYHTRQRNFEFTLPPEPGKAEYLSQMINQRLGVFGAEATINTRLETYKKSCINVGNTTGNDYSAHIAVIEALTKQALDIKDAFSDAIKETDGTHYSKSPLDVNIASVTHNVASRSEEFTASLMCGTRGLSCSK